MSKRRDSNRLVSVFAKATIGTAESRRTYNLAFD